MTQRSDEINKRIVRRRVLILVGTYLVCATAIVLAMAHGEHGDWRALRNVALIALAVVFWTQRTRGRRG